MGGGGVIWYDDVLNNLTFFQNSTVFEKVKCHIFPEPKIFSPAAGYFFFSNNFSFTIENFLRTYFSVHSVEMTHKANKKFHFQVLNCIFRATFEQ